MSQSALENYYEATLWASKCLIYNNGKKSGIATTTITTIETKTPIAIILIIITIIITIIIIIIIML